ncbi:MAG: hypothetical protein M3217_11490 [Actinomycetota bacterium]|nr:hypothetical protein [Actinomycetota bacterium]
MIRGLAMLLLLVVAGAFAGVRIGNWYLDATVPAPELESAIYPAVGGIAGGVAALALGLAIAYFVGRNEARKDR